VPGPILHIAGYSGPAYNRYPSVGEHTREVLVDELGLDAGEFQVLQTEGVVSSGKCLVWAKIFPS
jgi:hypothetical protein